MTTGLSIAQPVPPGQAPWSDRVWIDGNGYPRIKFVGPFCPHCSPRTEPEGRIYHEHGCVFERCPVCQDDRIACGHEWSFIPPSSDPIDAARAAYCRAQETVWRLDKTEGAAWAAYSNVEGTFTDLFPAWQAAHTALTQAEATLLSAQVAYKTAVQAESEGR
jgi:hypothetical protein